MSNDRYIELINQDVDGTISTDEKHELDVYLADHPDARRLHEQLKELPRLLSEVKQVEPPPQLKQEIISRLQAGSYRREQRRAKSAGFRLFGVDFDFKYAYGFAAGLIFGVAVYAIALVGVAQDGQLDPLDISGTALQRGASGETRTADSFAFDVEGAQGRLQADIGRDQAIIHIYVTSQRAIEIALNFNRNQVDFKGYRLTPGQNGEIKISAGGVRLVHEGDCEYHLLFGLLSGLKSDIRFEIYADGLLFERTIVLAGGDR
jgi:hypothetical protein